MKKYKIPKNANITKESENILGCMLEKNPYKRISAADLLKHKLFYGIDKNKPFIKSKPD